MANNNLPKVEENNIVVMPYDPQWPNLFEKEAIVVKEALDEDVAIEHFGSTAVPGLAAKPIIDILVGSKKAAAPSETQLKRLSALAYEYRGEDGRRPGRYFFRKRAPGSFNLSIVPFEGDLWRENLMVREYLRSHAEEVSKYAAIKLQGMEISPEPLLGYQDHKRVYMEEMKQRARQYFSNL